MANIASPAHFDHAQLDQISELDAFKPGLRNHLVELFHVNSAEQVGICRESIEAGDGDRLRRAAHTLKGVAASVGAQPLSRLAAEREAAAIRDEVTGLKPRWEALQAMWTETDGELERWRASFD